MTDDALDSLAPLLSATGPFWPRRNLRRLLCVLLPFAFVCLLTYKTLCGQWLNLNPSTYAAWPLGASLLFPLNIFQTPIQALILGILLSLLIVVPILTAQYFGVAPAAVFVACIFALAHLPMLALFSACGVILAGTLPLFRRSRFYAAFLGLFPLMIYLLLATHSIRSQNGHDYIAVADTSRSALARLALALVSPTAVYFLVLTFVLLLFVAGLLAVLRRSGFLVLCVLLAIICAYLVTNVVIVSGPLRHWPSGRILSASELVWPEMLAAGQDSRQALLNLSPLQQTWLYIPALLALCLSLLMMALLQLANRWTKRSSQLLAATTALIALLCLLLFWRLVGPQTLDYAILKARFQPNSFLSRDFPDLDHLDNRISPTFKQRVALARQACLRFLDNYPNSRHKPHILHIISLIQDAHLDYEYLRAHGLIRVYYDFPSPQSHDILQQLLEEFGENVFTCPAGLQLGRLFARQGRFTQALHALEQSQLAGRKFLRSKSDTASTNTVSPWLGLPPAEPISPQQIPDMLMQSAQLSELISTTCDDPLRGSDPLRRFCAKDPKGPRYIKQIQDILDEFPDALVADHIRLQIILAQPVADQILLLQAALEQFRHTPAARKNALFCLAQAQMHLAALDSSQSHLTSRAVENLRNFLKEYPQAYQHPLAQDYLDRLNSLALP